MKKIIPAIGLVLFSTLAHSQNGLDSIILEKFYISNPADEAGSLSNSGGILPTGSVTYRIYAQMQPGYKFQALYGIGAHELKLSTTTTFFNNEDRGAIIPNAISVANTMTNTVLLDSWFSVGATANGKVGVLKIDDTDGAIANSDGLLQNADSRAGIALTTQDGMVTGTPKAVTFVGFTAQLDSVFDNVSQASNLFSTKNASIASLTGSVGPTSANRVLLGQFTTDGQFCYELNIQIGTPTGGVQKYVAKNPTGPEILIPSLVGCIDAGTATAIKDDKKENHFSYKVSPNPANDVVTIQFDATSSSSKDNSYTIYGVQGNLLIQKHLGAVTEKQTEIVDISGLAPGFYFIKLSVDGTTSTKKIMKN